MDIEQAKQEKRDLWFLTDLEITPFDSALGWSAEGEK
jgi:hypothetical protein